MKFAPERADAVGHVLDSGACRGTAGIETSTVIRYLESEHTVLLFEVDRRASVLSGMFGRVL
jgi:sporulation-control protein spo0M